MNGLPHRKRGKPGRGLAWLDLVSGPAIQAKITAIFRKHYTRGAQ